MIGPNCMGVINTAADVRLNATELDVNPFLAAPDRRSAKALNARIRVGPATASTGRGLAISVCGPLARQSLS
ncbi:MAG TPA: hypothetical protein VGR07_12990 [Thermoanaerobaculia bacterium]|jgi:hypothetical protein|nr:hypothetical protein [Thermoanaerobaculia bacterium]